MSKKGKKSKPVKMTREEWLESQPEHAVDFDCPVCGRMVLRTWTGGCCPEVRLEGFRDDLVAHMMGHIPAPEAEDECGPMTPWDEFKKTEEIRAVHVEYGTIVDGVPVYPSDEVKP